MPFINIGTVVPFPAHIVQEAGAYSGEMEGWWAPPQKKGTKERRKMGKYFILWVGKIVLLFRTHTIQYFSVFRDKRESNMYNMYIWCLLSTPLGGGILSKDLF